MISAKSLMRQMTKSLKDITGGNTNPDPPLTIEDLKNMKRVMKNLSSAFSDLRDKGFLTEMDYLCCFSCASVGVVSQAEDMVTDGKMPAGAVFYHGQDTDGWKECGCLCLAYHGEDGEDPVLFSMPLKDVGYTIVEALKKHDVPVRWDGDVKKRIKIGKDQSVFE